MNESSNPPGEATIRRALRRGAGLFIGLVILVGMGTVILLRTDLGSRAIDHLIQNLRPGPILLAFLLISMAFFFMALRWRALMPAGHRPPATGLSAMICTGLLLNYTVPGPVGEFGAAWFAHRRYRIPLEDSLASGLTARLVGLATAGVLAGLAWSFGTIELEFEQGVLTAARLRELAIVMGLIAFLAVFFVLRPEWWSRTGVRLLAPMARVPRLSPLIDRLSKFVVDLARSVNAVRVRGGGPLCRAAFWALCGHGSVIVGIWVAATSMGASPSFEGLVFTYATATALAMALFAFPGSQLGWDIIFGGLLLLTANLGSVDSIADPEAYRLTAEGTAAAIVLLVRVQQLGFMLLGATVMAWLVQREVRGSEWVETEESGTRWSWAWPLLPWWLALTSLLLSLLWPMNAVYGQVLSAGFLQAPRWLLISSPAWIAIWIWNAPDTQSRRARMPWVLVGVLGFGLGGIPPSWSEPERPEESIRMVTVNVNSFSDQVDPAPLEAALADLDADIVMVIEQRVREIPGLALISDNFDADLPRISHATAVFCRSDSNCEALVTPEFGSDTMQMPIGLVRLSEFEICLLAIHGPPPIPYDPTGLQPYVDEVARHIESGRMSERWGPCRVGDRILLAGDLNAVPGSRAWSTLRRTGLQDRLLRWGVWAASWPSGGGWPNFPFFQLDHLMTGDVAVPRVEMTRVPGSDHRALIVDFVP